MMTLFAYLGMVFAALLAVVMALIFRGIIADGIRAARQVRRIVDVMAELAPEAPPTWPALLRVWWRQFVQPSALRIGTYLLPENPRDPIERRFPA